MAYPIFVNLSGRRCVLIGGGPVAARRTTSLLEQGARVTVVAPEITESLQALAADNGITWMPEQYSPRHIDDAFLVMAATNDAHVNASVARDAQSRGVLVCRTDSPEDGTFIVPAFFEQGDLTIAIATGGNSPTLTAVLRSRLRREFGPEWAVWTQLFSRLRPVIQKFESDMTRRRLAESVLGDRKVAAYIAGSDLNAAEQEALHCISSQQA